MDRQTRRTLAASIAVNIVFPLGAYYLLRAQGAAQWLALLLSGAAPAVRAAYTLAVRRRADGFDLFVVSMLALSAGTSLISGEPRVMLLKNVALSLGLAVWILGTLYAPRPFVFQFSRRWHGEAARAERDRLWAESAEFRRALRRVTMLWGGAQLVDAALSTLTALTLPVDAVPAIEKVQSYGLLGLLAAATLLYGRRFRARHGVSLIGYRRGAAAPEPAVSGA
ncbi:VC0807 family protein [Streptomyces sp. NPDC050617]|uniref:VC0807 family protein n=1 Tax=Streptomyces sp. NPDC050617 TaxID=3154628 RepID=UPI00341D2079